MEQHFSDTLFNVFKREYYKKDIKKERVFSFEYSLFFMNSYEYRLPNLLNIYRTSLSVQNLYSPIKSLEVIAP